MRNTKLLKIFQTFSAWDCQALNKFVKSPYFNKRQDIIDLLEYLVFESRKEQPDYKAESAFAYVYPDKSFEPVAFRLLCTYTFKLVEQFLVVQDVGKDTVFIKKKLAEIYSKKKLSKFFIHSIKIAKANLEKSSYRNDEYWQTKFELDLLEKEFQASKQRLNPDILQGLTTTFEIAKIASIVKHHSLLIAQEDASKVEYEKELLHYFIQYIKNRPNLLEIQAIAIYYYFYEAMQYPESGFFEKMLLILQDHQDKFPPKELRVIHILASNFCINRSNLGEKHYLEIYVKLNEIGLKNEVLLVNGMLNRFSFKNIIVSALRLNKLQKAEQLLNKYIKLLNPIHQKNMYNLCLAKIRYHQGNYKEAMPLLAQFHSNDVVMILDVKNMQRKIYHELKELNALVPHLKNMRNCLKRYKKKIAVNRFNFYELVLKLHTKLLKIKDFDASQIALFKKEIATITLPQERDWFLKELKKLGL